MSIAKDILFKALNTLLSDSQQRVVSIPLTFSKSADGQSDPSISLWRGLPWLSEECSQRWLGPRSFLFVGSCDHKNRIAIVSSRFRQRLDLETRWFDLLRTTVLQCDPLTDVLVTVSSTASFPAASRAARLFDRPVLDFVVSQETQTGEISSLERWLADAFQQIEVWAPTAAETCDQRVFVSPPLPSQIDTMVDERFWQATLPDRLLFAAATRVQVLSCRPGGDVEELIGRHLLDSERQEIPLLVASDESGRVPPFVREPPPNWVPWIVAPLHAEADSAVADGAVPNGVQHGQQTSESQETRSSDRVGSSPLVQPDDWLIHWTRASRGPWPGETHEDFLDALILRTETADHSVMATLLKIIADRILVASSEGIRGGYSVLAFTAVPLTEFRDRRIFRKHRNRFDFELWGIAIRKSDLMALGCRPVIYGHSEDWDLLPENDRPFFQKATDGGATNNVAEREWRIKGDIALGDFPKNSVCIFVDSVQAAKTVQRHCEWRVIVVPGSPDQ